jgi:hypothetical protein
MRKIQVLLVIASITLLGCLLQACSADNEKAAEKGKTEELTDKAANRIIKGIQDPISQARKASEIAKQQNEEREKRLNLNE